MMTIPTESEFLKAIVETLNLPDDQEITPETPLFGLGLGLNSIDALEIGAAINQNYKVELKPKDEATRQAFSCVRTLHAFVVNAMSQAPEVPKANVA